MNKRMIFGDIEGFSGLTQQVINALIDSNNNRMIFLGDLFDTKRIDPCLELIEQIMTRFNIEINFNRFTVDNVLNQLKYECNYLRSQKALDKYVGLRYSSWKNIPNERNYDVMNCDSQRCIFIMGNKEALFPNAILGDSSVTLNDDESVSIDYVFMTRRRSDRYRLIRHSFIITLSIRQLNVLFAYLNECHNYVIMNNILYIHNIYNAKFIPNELYHSIVCGHNKGYGKFIDEFYPDKLIYMNDFTERDVEDVTIVNDPIHMSMIIDESIDNYAHIELGFDVRKYPEGLHSVIMLDE